MGKTTRRVMWSSIQKGLREHVDWLREFEGEFYDAQDRLRDDVRSYWK